MRKVFRTVALTLMAAAVSVQGVEAQGGSPTPSDCFDVSGFLPTFDHCFGAYDGNAQQELSFIQGLLETYDPGTTWSWLGSADDEGFSGPDGGTNPISGATWGQTAGYVDFQPAISGAHALALKAGNFYSVYIWDNLPAGTSRIEYNTAGVASNVPALSNVALFGNPVSVPEPGSMVLLASGLLGLGFIGNRRRRVDA